MCVRTNDVTLSVYICIDIAVKIIWTAISVQMYTCILVIINLYYCINLNFCMFDYVLVVVEYVTLDL